MTLPDKKAQGLHFFNMTMCMLLLLVTSVNEIIMLKMYEGGDRTIRDND